VTPAWNMSLVPYIYTLCQYIWNKTLGNTVLCVYLQGTTSEEGTNANALIYCCVVLRYGPDMLDQKPITCSIPKLPIILQLSAVFIPTSRLPLKKLTIHVCLISGVFRRNKLLSRYCWTHRSQTYASYCLA
jgi:hypothetical protein